MIDKQPEPRSYEDMRQMNRDAVEGKDGVSFLSIQRGAQTRVVARLDNKYAFTFVGDKDGKNLHEVGMEKSSLTEDLPDPTEADRKRVLAAIERKLAS